MQFGSLRAAEPEPEPETETETLVAVVAIVVAAASDVVASLAAPANAAVPADVVVPGGVAGAVAVALQAGLGSAADVPWALPLYTGGLGVHGYVPVAAGRCCSRARWANVAPAGGPVRTAQMGAGAIGHGEEHRVVSDEALKGATSAGGLPCVRALLPAAGQV